MSIPEGKNSCPRCKGKGFVGQRINARSKGQRGEREVVKILQAVVDTVHYEYGTPPPIIQRNQLQSHLGGEDLTGIPGFSVEVKFCETLNVKKWWEQCLRQATKSQAQPILIYRRSNETWTVRLRVYINTPKDVHQVEMDVEMDVDEFLNWFKSAYHESLPIREIVITPQVAKEIKQIFEPPNLVKEAYGIPYIPPESECVCHTGAQWCPECHGR